MKFNFSVVAPVLASLVLAVVVSSCGSAATGKVSLAIKTTGSSRRSMEFLNRLEERSNRNMQVAALSFTPTSVKLPIMKISLSKLDGSNEQVVYRCPNSTEAGCMVDIANQSALDAIVAAASLATVDQGTYDQVTLATCAAGSSGSTATTAKITGSGTGPGGANWTTNASTVVDLTGLAAQETTVGNWSCSSKVVIVRGGIVVGANPLTLSIVVDNFMSAYFGNTVSGGQGGCKVLSSNGFCLTYPALMAYVGTTAVTTKRFAIAHNQGGAATPSQANALIIVAYAGGTPLMEYGRTYFTATSEVIAANTKTLSGLNPTYTLVTGGPSYVTETVASSFSVNANGTIAFQQGGSADTFASRFTAFNPAATHSATVTSQDGVDTWNYTATIIP